MPQSPQLLAQELAEHKRQIVADYRRHRSPQRFFADHTALLSHTVTALWRQMQPTGGAGVFCWRWAASGAARCIRIPMWIWALWRPIP